MASSLSTEDWSKGIALSILASLIGGASKLAIRKSWLMELHVETQMDTDTNTDAFADIVGAPSVYSNAYPLLHTSGDSYHLQEDDSSQTTRNTSEENESGNDVIITNPRHSNTKLKPSVAYSLRLFGMLGMTFLNPFCCVLAMNYASPSILAPFSGLTLVWIVLFSNVFIDEKPTRQQVLAASFIVAGEGVVAVFGDHTNDTDVTLMEVRESYQRPLFLFYFFVIALWMTGLSYVINYGDSPSLRRFAWGVSGGSITGLQNFLKDSLTIVKVTNDQSSSSYPWYLYATVSLSVLTAFVGLLLLTACMKRHDATYSSAMFVGSFVISASIMSAVHYDVFSNLKDVWNFIMYPVGLVILMVGVVMLAYETEENRVVEHDDQEVDPVSVILLQKKETEAMKEALIHPITTSGGEGDLAW